MKRWITWEDLIDVYVKLHQRGIRFLLSKLTFNSTKKSISAFDASLGGTSNWWEIPLIKERWNRMITGDSQIDFKSYFINKYLSGAQSPLRVLSLGSGYCQHELVLASCPLFREIVCLDINQGNLDEAAAQAKEKGLHNLSFCCKSIEQYDFASERFDMVMFNNSLHHFRDVRTLLGKKIKQCLKPEGMLLINEYVGATRFQFSRMQIQAINKAIRLIDKPYRRRYKTSLYKKRYYGTGWLRVFLADPSEAVDSANIMPAVHEYYHTIEEKPFGGNILAFALKDIAFHFATPDRRSRELLESLFQFENDYLKEHRSDFVFGLYRLKTHET